MKQGRTANAWKELSNEAVYSESVNKFKITGFYLIRDNEMDKAFVTAIDASKAFDKVNRLRLWLTLIYIIGLELTLLIRD